MKPQIASRRTFAAHLLQTATLVAAAPPLIRRAHANEAMTASAARNRPARAVVHWNTVASEAFAPSQGTNPMAQSRTFAILHAAIHDALNAIKRRYEAYTPGLPMARHASAEAAVAAAAREVLVALVPDQAALVEAAYGRALAAVRHGAPKAAGVSLGRAAAATTMDRRRYDGANRAGEIYVPRPGPGEYQFTPPFTFAAQPGWGRVHPFAITLQEHHLAGPLPLTSPDYARDLAEVKEIGHAESATRTAEQSEVARFWYEDSPLGWNRIANGVVRRSGLDAWEAARAFALLHFAMADGFIAGFAEKYEHRFWRPETAIRAAAKDGNPLTQADPGWQPFLRVTFEPGRAQDYPGAGYDLICFFDCLHDMGDPVAAAAHAARALAPDGTVMLVEPFANDRVEDNISPVGRLYYAASTTLCCAHAISDGGRLVLGAQAGEARLAEVFRKAGFTRFRSAAETPFNLILEARL